MAENRIDELVTSLRPAFLYLFPVSTRDFFKCKANVLNTIQIESKININTTPVGGWGDFSV